MDRPAECTTRLPTTHVHQVGLCLLLVTLLVAGCSDDGRDPVVAPDGTTDAGNGEDNPGNGSTTAGEQAGVRLNEIVASNQLGLADEDGDTSDWIELHNPSAEAVDLSGWHLSDDEQMPDKWALPPVSLPAGGYVIVFASDKDRAAAGAELHTNFRLSASGEYLGLSGPEAIRVVDEFAPAYPALLEDQAYGVQADGTLGVLPAPTPAAANSLEQTAGQGV